MRKFLLVLLLLPLVVNADHHRGHTLGFIDKVEFHADQAVKWTNTYVSWAENSGCSFSPADQQSIEVLFRYTGFIKDNMAVVRGLVENGELDEARRKVTRPNSQPPNSADTLMEGLVHRVRSLMTSCPGANVALGQVLKRFAHMWTNIDRVNWHIQDAIREEIYFDPEFICSGPNNHC